MLGEEPQPQRLGLWGRGEVTRGQGTVLEDSRAPIREQVRGGPGRPQTQHTRTIFLWKEPEMPTGWQLIPMQYFIWNKLILIAKFPV